MKRLIPFVLAGMFGGLMTWGMIQYNTDSELTTESKFHLMNNGSKSSSKLPFDFADAAEIASPSVVLIQANINNAKSR